ncbi:MAG: 2-isopropylmalate synthase [Proteobacteria bacterium]|nr:2-isopropylmalate synthase [Pseudomonadota bacterium]
MEYVKIFDTTLRDGEQAAGASMNIEEKLRIALQLEKLGVDIIEAGFPAASEGDFEAVKNIAKNIVKSEVAGLARATEDDITKAWEAVKYANKPRIHTFLATSDIHLKYKLKIDRAEALKRAVWAVKFAKKFTDNVEFSAEDACRTNIDFLCEVVEAVISAGATTVNIPDTVGYITPQEFYEIIKTLKNKVKNINKAVISVHCHNDLGLAVANSLSAILAGARQVECTINGIGERAGNAAMEEIVMSLKTRKDFFNFNTKINTKHIYRTSKLVSQITGMIVQPNKAIVGANAFAHESGIHQDGVLKERLTYEIMTPESVGIPQSLLVLGKLSGRHAFKKRVEEMGYELTEEQLNKAFKRFKELCDQKKHLYDEDIDAIISQEILNLPEKFKFVFLNVVSGNRTTPCATVEIEEDGKIIKEATFGNGPVDAVFNAIKRITKTKSKLLSFVISAITTGTDAQGEVTVKLEQGGKQVLGKGVDPDVLVASAKAYINALNKLELKKDLIKVNREDLP